MFKVGDKVKIIGYPDIEHKTGDVGVVCEITLEDGYAYTVFVARNTSTGAYDYDELLLVESAIGNIKISSIQLYRAFNNPYFKKQCNCKD